VPRILRLWETDAEVASARDALIAQARVGAQGHDEEIKAAGEWLDEEYAEAQVRKLLTEARRNARRAIKGQPILKVVAAQPTDRVRRFRYPGDHLRGDRLESAISDLTAAFNREKFSLLGPNQPKAQRRRNAVRAVVVTACVVDPDAQEWLANVTELATCAWVGNSSARPEKKGRADVADHWAREALRLLEAALSLLGWGAEPAGREAEAEGVVDEAWGGSGMWTTNVLSKALGCSRDALSHVRQEANVLPRRRADPTMEHSNGKKRDASPPTPGGE
jgi:hypothetical protein